MKNIYLLALAFYYLPLYACPLKSGELTQTVQRMNLENEYGVSNMIQSESGIKKQDFDTIITALKNVYVPKFKKQNLNFEIIHAWNSPDLKASADQRGRDKLVILHGGFARLKYMSFDAYLLVGCHEVGHHLGGFPLKNKSTWPSSAEGQADYFASLKCFKEVLKSSKEIFNIKTAISIPNKSKSLCKLQYPFAVDYQICLRGAQAAFDFGKMLYHYSYPGFESGVSLLNTMPSITGGTFTVHADPQCRTETLYQGILCNKDINSPLSMTDETQGTCHRNNLDRVGLRPGCWFVSN